MMPKKLYIKKLLTNTIFNPLAVLNAGSYKNGFRVLNYHSITDRFLRDDYYQMTTPLGIFKWQMEYLYDNDYSVLGCGEIVDRLLAGIPMPAKAICVTFDDGFKDNLTNAIPILKKYAFKATIFPAIDFIGREGWLDWDEILDISKYGNFSFGSHTVSHRKLCDLGRDELSEEIKRSKNILEDKLNQPIELFAYPFGSYGSFNKMSMEMIRSAGYKAAFTTIGGWNNAAIDPFRVRRTRISWFDDKNEFIKELAGSYDWYRAWQRLAGTP